MIIDISDYSFKRIFEDKSFDLPIRWEGTDFSNELNKLFDRYVKRLFDLLSANSEDCFTEVFFLKYIR